LVFIKKTHLEIQLADGANGFEDVQYHHYHTTSNIPRKHSP